jgi:DNA invertase Pin-like site-specific DNA recombinase
MPLPAEEAPLRFAERQREARRIKEMLDEGLRKAEVARELGRSRMTVWRRENGRVARGGRNVSDVGRDEEG